MNGYFIDWLTVRQTHEVQLPEFGKAKNLRIDLQTGAASEGHVYKEAVQGSFSTVLQISCDGHTVIVDGNPSRYGRPDNLFGYPTIDQCINVYNRILIKNGLPPFSKNTKIGHKTGKDGAVAQKVGNGALIYRIDWTKNHRVGHNNVIPFIRAMSSQSIGKSKEPNLYSNGRTCDWGRGSAYFYVKIYDKSFEIVDKTIKSQSFKKLSDDVKQYMQRLKRYCDGVGIVREEHSIKRQALVKYNLNLYGKVTFKNFAKYIKGVGEAMSRLEVNTYDYTSISDQLMECPDSGVKSRQSANSTEAFALKWLHGAKLEKTRQYYVHLPRLRAIGIDIAVPLDISKKLPTVKNEREITVRPITLDEIPPWYSRPGKPILKLVA